MRMTLEGGLTLQRHPHRQMACWITIAGGLELSAEMEMSTPYFFWLFFFGLVHHHRRWKTSLALGRPLGAYSIADMATKKKKRLDSSKHGSNTTLGLHLHFTINAKLAAHSSIDNTAHQSTSDILPRRCLEQKLNLLFLRHLYQSVSPSMPRLPLVGTWTLMSQAKNKSPNRADHR
jgi:hypothetical protein